MAPAPWVRPTSGITDRLLGRASGKMDKPACADEDIYEGVKAALRVIDGVNMRIEHLDLMCDGCGREPIVGDRFKCSVCKDRDLCSNCMRGLVTARVLQAQESSFSSSSTQEHTSLGGDTESGHSGTESMQNTSDQKSGKPAWMQPKVRAAVPCLSPKHTFNRMEGPERLLRLVGGTSDSQPLESFISTFPPSRASCSDIAWIAADRDETAGQVDELDTESGTPFQKRVDGLLEEWEALLAGRHVICQNTLDKLAASHGVLRGKWMLFPHRSEIDRCWAAIAQGVVNGLLGPTAKASSASPIKDSHVICVTVQNYQDEDDLRRVCLKLKEIVPEPLRDTRLLLKPDAYTILGIYASNEWGIKASVVEDRLSG